MNDRLSADEHAALTRTIDAAAATLKDAGSRLGEADVDADALRNALAAMDRSAVRLMARGSSQDRTRAEKAIEATQRLIVETVAPNLIRLLLAHTPVPGGPPSQHGGPSVIELAEFYRLVTDWMVRRDPRHPVVSALKRALPAFVDQARSYVEVAEAQMDGPDHPDLARIAANVLRLDVLTWTLVTAGFPREAGAVQARTRRLARSALRRATTVLNRCAGTFSLIDRINLAGTIAEIDHLVLIFQRVQEGDREEANTGGESFGQSLGTQVLNEFTDAVIRLSRAIMESFIAGGFDAPLPRQNEIAGMLSALSKLYRLFVGLGDENAAVILGLMAKEVRAGVMGLAMHLDKAMKQARDTGDAVRFSRLDAVRTQFLAFADSVAPSPRPA